MKKLLNITILVSLLILPLQATFAVPVAQAVSSQPAPGTYVPGQLIIKFRAGYSPTSDFLKNYSLNTPQKIATDLYILKTNSVTADILILVGQLSTNSTIQYSQPNFVYKLASNHSQQNYFFGMLWGLRNLGQPVVSGDPATSGLPGADINAVTAWNTYFPSGFVNNTTVCVVDTGVYKTHPDLDDPSRTITQASVIGGDGSDTVGHGTQIAGIIGALDNTIGVKGVNPRTNIISIKAFNAISPDRTPIGFSSDLVSAISTYKNQCNIFNLSWVGSNPDPALRTEISAAVNSLFIVAAGNGLTGTQVLDNTVPLNIDLTPVYPASYSKDLSNVVAVTATDNLDSKLGQANYGSLSVQLGAPGWDIVSTSLAGDESYPHNTVPGQPKGYGLGSGTSYSAAYVSGAVSLLNSYIKMHGFADLNPGQIKNLLISTVDKVPSLTGVTVSGGRLNVASLIAQVPSLVPRLQQ